jgi:hypothetical protein
MTVGGQAQPPVPDVTTVPDTTMSE